jgi:hypothetical protein
MEVYKSIADKALRKTVDDSPEQDCKENINCQNLSNKIFEKKLTDKTKIKKIDNDLFFKVEHIHCIFVNKRDIYTDPTPTPVSILPIQKKKEIKEIEEDCKEFESSQGFLCKRSYQESFSIGSN